MANVNIKFNNKDYLLSCDDGQEESLKKLTKFLDKKYSELKDKLGNIWVVNPFSEKYNHPLSVQLANNNQHWMHIFSEDDYSYIPTEIAFDRYNRLWVAFQNQNTNNNRWNKLEKLS